MKVFILTEDFDYIWVPVKRIKAKDRRLSAANKGAHGLRDSLLQTASRKLSFLGVNSRRHPTHLGQLQSLQRKRISKFSHFTIGNSLSRTTKIPPLTQESSSYMLYSFYIDTAFYRLPHSSFIYGRQIICLIQ
jgi:hypothetical protein